MPKTPKSSADNDNHEAIVCTRSFKLCTNSFEVALANQESIAISMASGTGGGTAARDFQAGHPDAVALVRLQQTGVAVALRQTIAAVAPSLFPQQICLFGDDDNIEVQLPRVPSISKTDLPTYVQVALRCFTETARQRAHSKALVIVTKMECLKSCAATDEFITMLVDAGRGLPIGFSFMGDERFRLPPHQGALLKRRQSRNAPRPLIRAALDKLDDVVSFGYEDVGDDDIKLIVCSRGYSVRFAKKICELRKYRRFCPSFRYLDRLLTKIPPDVSDEEFDKWVDDVISLPPSSRMAA